MLATDRQSTHFKSKSYRTKERKEKKINQRDKGERKINKKEGRKDGKSQKNVCERERERES